MQRKKQVLLLLALISLLLLSLSCNFVPSLLGNSKQFEDGIVQNYHPVASPVSQYTLSVTQQAYVDEHGYPDRFVIFFFVVMLPDGQLYAMRHESWYYDARGYEIVFRNGDKFTERNGAPIQIEGLGRTVYSPQGFTAEMNLDALLNIRGETGFFVQNVDDDLLTGELVFIQGLVAGFEDGHLSYVETLPLSEVSPLGETPSLIETPPVLEVIPLTATPPLVDTSPLEENSGGLTPQELASEGQKTYLVSCVYTEATGTRREVNSWKITFDFIIGGVNFSGEDGKISFYSQAGANTYEAFHDGFHSIIIFTDEGFTLDVAGNGLTRICDAPRK